MNHKQYETVSERVNSEGGAWSGENVIYLGNDSWWGHPCGIMPSTESVQKYLFGVHFEHRRRPSPRMVFYHPPRFC